MSPPADGSFPDRDLDEVSHRIEAAAREAYQRFLKLVDQGVAPRDAIDQVSAGFDSRYYRDLSQAFSKILAEPWTVRQMRDYPVNGVRLSSRLYSHWQQTAGEVTNVIRSHAAGMQQARELSLALYEGYGFRGVEPLKVLTGQLRTLPRELRALATDPRVRSTLLQTARRAAGVNLKTPALRSAYLQAFDEAIAGAAWPRLEQLLKVAVEEKSRYMADRIAQTELARAHSNRIGRELMNDATIEVVQWRLSAAHPRADICDLFANVDRYGLGPGVFPKRLAPQPIAHPFCRCRLRSRPDLRESQAVDRPGAEREYLQKFSPEEGARLLGSRDRLRRVMKGEGAREVWNRGLNDQYHVRTLGELAGGLPPTAPAAPPAVPPVAPAPVPAPAIVPPAAPAAPSRVFEAQRTVAKAAQWAMQNDIVDFADYRGIDVHVANEWNRSLSDHMAEFPKLRPAQKFTGTIQAQHDRFVSIRRATYAQELMRLGYPTDQANRIALARVKAKRTPGSWFAQSWMQQEVSGVSVNAKWGKDPAAFERALAANVATKFHPVGCDRIRSVVDHEMGHQLDALLGLRTDPEVQRLYREVKARNMTEELSGYAAKDIAEFIAEGWAEYLNNPRPRPVATRIGEIVRSRYGSRFPA